ncbi:MAG TPA: DNA repair protein RadC [Stellaceae bacterium]|nr:DNA repair protein RadC [Stellaceae bacterium]
MSFSIVEEQGRLIVTSPYHPNFPGRARTLGGSWDPERRVWLFEASDGERVRTLCREIYGPEGPVSDLERSAPYPSPARHGSNSHQFAEGTPSVPHYYGHRNRLRQRFLDADAEKLPDYELLEMILFAALQRGDVKPLAKAVLAHFGGFAETMSAEPAALAEAGLNLAGVAAIKSVREAALRLMRAELQEQPVINSWDKLIDYCTAQIAHNKVEEFHILFLDRKNVLLKHERQARGTIDHTPVYPREVVKRALELEASALILVHNHPSGDPTPSKADITMTQEIKKAAAPLGVTLHDHVIIGKNRHTSLRDLGLL